MPYYRINGMLVHLKLAGPKSKHPKPCCARISSTVGAGLLQCRAISTILCDWKLEDGGSCDAPICSAHAYEIGLDGHLCPIHAARHIGGEKTT